MPKMRLGWYAGASTALAGAVVFSAFQQRANFYSAMVYLSQSNFCLLVLINFTLLIYGTIIYGLSQLCWGTLRTAEVEQLTERAWFAITETCLAMTIFRDELGAWFLVMFTALVTGKVWGWIGDGRVEFLEQQPPANPRLFHTRLTVSLLMSFLYDIWILRYCINTVIQEAKADMMVMFLFEFAVLTTTSWRSGARYILSIIEQKMTQTQTQARLLERRQEIREQRDAIVRQRAEAATAGHPVETEEPLPNPEDVDEMDIEVPGWATKGEWVLWLDLLTDTIKLILYVTFFVLLTVFYTFPIHIMRDLLMTARDFLKRLNSVLRYRRAIQEMSRYPDATQAELDQENTCIICREDMRVWDLNANPGALDRIRPKKLPCGHILHLGCLKSWLERQQVCPTCRSPVTADRANPVLAQNANRAPALPQIPNQRLQAPLGFAQEPRPGRFGLEQPMLDPAAQAALNVDAFGRPLAAIPHVPVRANQPNVRPIEEFHEMIRDEERRHQEAEERARRRWHRALPPEVLTPQSQAPPSLQPSQQSEDSQQTSSQLSQPTQHTDTQRPGPSQAAQASTSQLEQESQRVFPAVQSQFSRQNQPQQSYNGQRSPRLRALANAYSQASILISQEIEALRVSTEQLQVLRQLVVEFDRLESASRDSVNSPMFAHSGEALAPEQLMAQQNLMLQHPNHQVVPSRTHSPSMARHVATGYSASIPAGSPDLPEGVSIPPGWSLMPLQRLDSQHQAHNAGTQRSSRTPSAGPATSPLGEEPIAQHSVSGAPTLQPGQQRTNVHVLERIPGTNEFRFAGPSGSGSRLSDTAVGNLDSLADAQPGTIISQQQLLERFFGRRGREAASRMRSDGPAGNNANTFTTSMPTDEQQVAPVASHSAVPPNWGGASQLFAGGVRGEATENVTAAMERATAEPALTFTPSLSLHGEGEGSGSFPTAATKAEDAQSTEGNKSTAKAVTMEDVSDEEDL